MVIADKAVGPGSTIIRYDYRPDKEHVFGGGGIAEIRVDGSLIASGRIGKTGFGSLPGGETIDVGRDTGIPVTARYQGWDRFTGEINKIVVSMP